MVTCSEVGTYTGLKSMTSRFKVDPIVMQRSIIWGNRTRGVFLILQYSARSGEMNKEVTCRCMSASVNSSSLRPAWPYSRAKG